MKISLNWLSSHVDLSSLDSDAIAQRLTIATAEVDGVELLENCAASAVVAEIVSVTPAGTANGKPLARVEVDAGAQRYVTMSTAPNVRAGMRVAFAPPGAMLDGGRVVDVAEVGGQRSEGMLCSSAELGLGRFHEIVIECPGTAALGASLSQWIPSRDVLIEIDNKSLTNRPDLWGHYGFARELAAIFGRELRPLDLVDLARYDALPAYEVKNEDMENCPVYTCVAFDVSKNVPSPLEMQARLNVVGQRCHNVLVDVTNYVTLELGQPTHAFDRDLTPAIRVAPVGAEGTFITLDGEKRRMEKDDLMIWNHRQPVAIAGVMGGLGSDVKPDTTRVLLESANFKASRVRRTSNRLALRTDASQRFEKGQPPSNTRVAAARILRLLDLAGAVPSPLSRYTVAGDLKDKRRTLTLPANYISSRAGVAIPDQRVAQILGSIGFGVRSSGEEIVVTVPPYRSEQDISIPADILEEVLRIYGYDNIPPSLPLSRLGPTPVNANLRREHKARRLLAEAHRFHEVQTYIWYDDAWLNEIGYQPGATLVLRNPIAEGKARLRTSMMPNLLALVPLNATQKDSFRLFEIGRVFQPLNGEHRETTRLAGLSYRPGRVAEVEAHYREIRGAVEDLGVMVAGRALRVELPADVAAGGEPWQIDGLWGRVMCDGEDAGAIGVLSGRIAGIVAPQAQVVWFDLDLEKLDGPVYPQVTYAAPPVYPGSWQDFSMLWKISDGFAALERKLGRFAHPLVANREFLFLYKAKELEPGMASYTFRYHLNDPTRTMAEQDLDRFRGELLEFLTREGIALR